jgi:transcriptional regulator with XRE-family HTH domain
MSQKNVTITTDMSDTSLHIIGRKLREVREKQHLTQSDVAEAADISTNHYAQIERGEANPSIETLEAILKALNVKSSKILPF